VLGPGHGVTSGCSVEADAEAGAGAVVKSLRTNQSV